MRPARHHSHLLWVEVQYLARVGPIVLGGRSLSFWKREDEAEEEGKEEDEEEGKECETMRSMGHRILPQGPATGHRAGAEFHRLPEKTRFDAVRKRNCQETAANVQYEKHQTGSLFLLISQFGMNSSPKKKMISAQVV